MTSIRPSGLHRRNVVVIRSFSNDTERGEDIRRLTVKGLGPVIRAVLFDLDGVLHDRDTSVRTLITQQHDLFAHALRHVSKDGFIKRFIELDARGYRPKDMVYQQLVTECQVTEISAGDLYDHFYATYHRCCAPF